MIRSTLKSLIKKVLGTSTVSQESSSKSSFNSSPKPQESTTEDMGSQLASIECGAQEVRERLEAGEPVVIIDVREIYELEQSGIIPQAKHIPLRELSTRWTELKDENEIVCYCAAGARSLNAAMLLRENGLFNATSMEGGFATWKAIGAPISRLDK